jgi:hypothetical protein
MASDLPGRTLPVAVAASPPVAAPQWHGDVTKLTAGERIELVAGNHAAWLALQRAFGGMTRDQQKAFRAEHPAWTPAIASKPWGGLTRRQQDEVLRFFPAQVRQLQDRWNSMSAEDRAAFSAGHPGLSQRIGG